MENKEPSGDDKPEQEARGQEYKQEAEQILRLQEQHILTFDPTFVFGLSNLYLLFVTAFVAFGMLAYYSGHLTILKAVFVVSGLLLLVLPVSAAWYLLASFKKKRKNKSRLPDRIAKSSFGRVLLRLFSFLNSRSYIVSQIALLVVSTALAIRAFPENPRLMLSLIVIDTVYLAYFIITFSLRWVESQIRELATFNKDCLSVLQVHERALHATFDTHEKIFAAIDATNRTVDELHTTTTLLMAENVLKAEQLDSRPTGDDEDD